MNSKEIIRELPYSEPFLFVDEITKIDENGVQGTYMLRKNSFFYEGHFKDNPVTPGVILTETMAQIGVVCLGIYLLGRKQVELKPKIALTSNQIDFYLPVFPGDKVKVVSEKIYYRFKKLKCSVRMLNEKNELVCRGEIAGMIVNE
ncbi:3-hydroxyacyl-ACP dehydratase FabZ family protein [Lutimonas zeaxanthinifaciens]|uniref:3-hydroxyacyl-ACP dehydratase FabZ family protein n=1 Tax=Lutimonas zeaxanthinifaciens TaxID=3060215 RepID=UPI00265D420C|nr:3-hydroxyacyl-ACP dehydratase FabZ family protein [Lutimonas sp. YSD2104]WKK64901.1 3-hydroxyacyl-ACP dehydratase FabZ family protein [Lutimonas sp. YSD2104]